MTNQKDLQLHTLVSLTSRRSLSEYSLTRITQTKKEEIGDWNSRREGDRKPVVNFINVKFANCMYKSLFSSYVLALNKLSYVKCARKTLMKLTTDRVRLRLWKREIWQRKRLFNWSLEASIVIGWLGVFVRVWVKL